MAGISTRTAVFAFVVIAAGAAVFGLVVVGLVLFPSNDDVLVHNATSHDLVDVVVVRGEGADAVEVARFPRIAPGERPLADAGLGPISVEFTDSRGRWTADRELWRDEDDVRAKSEPQVLDVTDDAVGGAPVRRKP